MQVTKEKKSLDVDTDEMVETPEYEPDNFIDEIEDKYGDVAGWISVKIYRKNQQGQKFFLKQYDSPPDLNEIQSIFGGGEYIFYLKWKDKAGKKIMVTKTALIEGAPIALNASPNINTNPILTENNNKSGLDDALDLIIKLKNAGVIGNNNGGSDVTVALAGIEKSAEIMMKAAEIKAGGGGSDAKIEKLYDRIADMALQKSAETDLDKLEKTMNVINKLAPKNSGGGENTEILEVVKEGIKILPTLGLGKQTAALPGAVPGGVPGNFMEQINKISEAINQNFNVLFTQVNNIQKDLNDIKGDVQELQNEVFEPEPGTADAAETPANVTELNNTNGSAEPTEKETALKQGAWLRALPDEQKAEQLKNYVAQYGIAAVYKWCIDNAAVDTLDEFNRITKLAGLEAFNPA